MQRVLIIGAGKIGSLVAFLLANAPGYHVFLVDQHLANRPDIERILATASPIETHEINIQDSAVLREFLKKNSLTAIISCLPYYHNTKVAALAKEFKLHYFDLTEDRQMATEVARLAQDSERAFVPQCGLAPGFISIVANNLMHHFPRLDTVKLRVGALPTNISNSLQYALTWSTDGLINEYGNLCHAIENGKEILLHPLEDLEEIDIDGLTYEAFNTSGGIGSLAQTYADKVQHINYKTIRYPGHCAKMRFLMNDLKLNHDRDVLKRILENAIPSTYQDVVLVYVSVIGHQGGKLLEENYFQKFYPETIKGITWSAIQMTTASSLCTAVDLVLNQPGKYRGLIQQEIFSLDEFLNNQFGEYYRKNRAEKDMRS